MWPDQVCRQTVIEFLRYWNPPTSPIVVNWQLLATRYAERFQPVRQPVVWLESGTGGGASLPPAPNALLPRWTGSSTRFTLSDGEDPLIFRFAYNDFRTAAHLPPAAVEIKLDGQTVPEDHLVRRHDDVYLWIVFAYLDGLPHQGQPSIELDTTTWVPAQVQPWQYGRPCVGHPAGGRASLGEWAVPSAGRVASAAAASL